LPGHKSGGVSARVREYTKGSGNQGRSRTLGCQIVNSEEEKMCKNTVNVTKQIQSVGHLEFRRVKKSCAGVELL